jgi:hypothetical protein
VAKDGQPGTLVLFDIKKRSAVDCIVQEHRFACLPRQFGEIGKLSLNIAACIRPSSGSRAARFLLGFVGL